jgi:hypothetical protein
MDTLLTNDEFIPHLIDLLLYHVLSGAVFPANLSDGSLISALNSEDIW